MPKRCALLIGVSRYTDERLKSLEAPAADVGALERVLKNPEIAAFDEVKTLVDPTRQDVVDSIDDLTGERGRDDLVLLYFSGHGIRDDRGQLFFALTGTRYARPRGTALPASELKHFMDECGSRRQVLILDCCHAGAFMDDARMALGAPALTETTFDVKGYGREILAATNAAGCAFEPDRVAGDGISRQLGKFTSFLVEGLSNGVGLPERDEITVGDLFDFARKRLLEVEPRMRPQHWRERGEAPIVIARNPYARAQLPEDLLAALVDADPWARRGAVAELEHLMRANDPRLAAAARHALTTREGLEEHRLVHTCILQALQATPSAPQMPVAPVVGCPRYLSPGTVFRELAAPWCPEMVVVPAGRFIMGSPEHEKGWCPESILKEHYFDREEEFLAWRPFGPICGKEERQHEVVIARPFALGRYPVTFPEYDAYCQATGRERPEDEGFGRGRRPVINVSWDDAQDYLRWLSERTGAQYRLPSEAEWEYAARAGSTTAYPWGPDWDSDCANGNASSEADTTTKVGEYPPNAWGLYDMIGNVWEWTEDRWHRSYDGAPSDGTAWLAGSDEKRVVRGGGWLTPPDRLRSAHRGCANPGGRGIEIGFRVCRTLGF